MTTSIPLHIQFMSSARPKFYDFELEAIRLKQYMETRFVRFLVSQFMISQDITKKRFAFVPLQDFSEPWTDEKLYAKYGITEEEQTFIESMIRPMDLGNSND